MFELRLPRLVLVLAASLLALSAVHPVEAQAPVLPAQERLCDPAFEDCRADILTYIQQETVAIDMAYWMMTDARYANALVAAWNRGVRIRLLMDPRCAPAHPACVAQNDQLRLAGIPMRQRQASGILHWKAIIFVGQGQVEFAGTNYAPFEMSPEIPFVNYTDEIVAFTKEPSLVQSFMTKFDDMWISDDEFADHANVARPLTRSFPVSPIDPELNFPPDESFRSRSVAAYDAEDRRIDAVMFRITDGAHPEAMLRARQRGVDVRLITDETEYRNRARLMDAYYVDLLYAGGIPIRVDAHLGINHQKSVVLHGTGTSIIGSSNWTDASDRSQREHNYFTVKPWIFEWLTAQFERKWTNGSGFAETKPFVPLPPDAPVPQAPAQGAAAVPVTGAALSWYAGVWAHKYDIYFGTSPDPPLLHANLPLGPSQSGGDHRTVALPALDPGTTYYWKVVSKTMANVTAAGPVHAFTTAGAATDAVTPSVTITVVRRPYLQQPTASSMVIVWATRESGAASVRYGAAAGSTRTSASATSRLVTAAASGLSFDYYQHSATLTGLSASTTYAYQPMVGTAAAGPETTFKTAPPSGGGSISFIAFADSGTGSAEQRQLADVMSRDAFDLAVHAGDIAYGNSGGTGDATYATYQSYFFDVYNWLPAKPFVPVEGNHDSRPSNGDGKAYLDIFELPRNGASSAFPDHAERYYSFDYGPVHFVALDTEFAFQDTTRRAEQLRWLDADLRSTTQPWIVAVLHRAPYSSGGEHGSSLDVRAAFGPLFERYGVDVVLSAHEHTYERTVPIRESTNTADAFVTYIVTGGGGAPLYPAGTSSWTAFSASIHQYMKIAADACTLTLNAVGLSGAAADSASIDRCGGQPGTLPAGWSHADVGNTGAAGSATASGGTFTVTGAGADVWGTADAFHYAYRTLDGDGSIVARVSTIQNVNAWTKAGVMIRNSLSPSAAQAFMVVAASPLKGVPFQRRPVDGGASVSTSGSQSTAPRWVKLVRAGNLITGYESADGVTWTTVGSDTFAMGSTVLVGLAVSSHVTGVNATATFDNVTVTATAPPPPNVPPAVSITAPASGARFTAPAAVTVTAAASDSDGTVARVDFFAGSTAIGTATTAPYSVTWSGVPAGTYTITAIATDNASAQTTSSAVTITVDAAPPASTLPSGWSHADIGNTGAAGDAGAAGGTFTVKGAGADVWGTADAFQYAYRTLTGDGSIVARVATIENVNAWTKAGVMIRNSTSPSAAHAFMVVAASPLKGVPFQRRTADGGGSTSTAGSQSTAPRWVKLVRTGNVITGYESPDGVAWTAVSSDTFAMGQTVLIGLAVSSHVTGVNATATFDNVTVAAASAPPPPAPALPDGWTHADVGYTGVTGDATAANGTFTVTGGGADVWGTADALQYAYRTLTGDGTIVARVATIQNVHAWTKAGVMIRNSNSPSAAQAFMLVAASATKGVPFQRRTSDGNITVSTAGSQSTVPRWVKLVRAGNVITGYESPDGLTWTMVGSDTFAMGPTVLIGLGVSSHVSGVSATATFDNVTITPGG
ncbi:MAG TPA: phospholipase D-like domain-containing protein [Vicinamibacterales bacterium]|nr:phospholipase D-like domain-containing protein [Vicinamibacterales bacterium]